MESRPSYTKKPVRGFLSTLDGGRKLEFQFNPPSISRNEEASYSSHQSQGALDSKRIYVGGADRSISFTLQLSALAGRGGVSRVKQDLAILESFTYPEDDSTAFVSPPMVILGLGDRTWQGWVKLSINEKQFDKNLNPVLIEVNVDFTRDVQGDASFHASRRKNLIG